MRRRHCAAIFLFCWRQKVDDYTVDLEVSAPTSLFLNDITNIFIFNAKWLKDNNSEAYRLRVEG